VLAPAAFALSMASTPRLRAAGGGGDQICVHWLSATPQYAMPQLGSAWAMAAKAFADSRYQKECRSATARSKGFCMAGAHDTGKTTWPIFSPAGGVTCAESGTSPSASKAAERTRAMTITARLDMAILPEKSAGRHAIGTDGRAR